MQNIGGDDKVESIYNNVPVDSFPNWEIGKRFVVVDDNVKRIFRVSSHYDVDTISFIGRVLEYKGFTEWNVFDNEPKVNLVFFDGINEYIYPTNKTLNEISRQKLLLQVPFMVEDALVNEYRRLIVGNHFYIRTSIWYNESGQMIPGRKFVKVRILNVSAGDKVFPLKVSFITTDGNKACVYMATKQSSVQNRLFDNLFSVNDVRLNYPSISDTVWQNIVNGTVVEDMSKDECRLSLGTPNSIQERPTYDGLHEYWFYSNGMYLVFFDGLLKQYRK